MSTQDFNVLETKLVELFQNRQYADALALVQHEGRNFPNDRPWIDYWCMCAAARLGNHPLVYQIAERFLADGFWYGDLIWRTTPSFHSLQGNPDFERIVAAHRGAEELDAPTSQPVLHLYTPENYSNASPLLVALHGNETTAIQNYPFWRGALTQGWILAMPQSDQAAYKGAYVWNELDKAFANVQAHYARLQQQIAIEPRRVILAAYSLGGLVAIQMALEGTLDVGGFLAVAPVIPFQGEAERLEAVLPAARERGVRGYFILGAQDDVIPEEGVRTFADKLNAAGIVCGLEVIPEAAHTYAPNYEHAVMRALDFMSLPT